LWKVRDVTVELVVASTDEISRAELAAIRSLIEEAFEGTFDENDWVHALGGTHVYVVDGVIVAHAAVVPRTLVAADRELRTGYVEGVATARTHRHLGLGSKAMREIAAIIATSFELGALATGVQGFYHRLGWESWRGPTYVSSPSGRVRTADDDGGILIMRTPRTPELDTRVSLTCDWRQGDVW
jgi:aminoglycoside 2'-N-acetyltransferase I